MRRTVVTTGEQGQYIYMQAVRLMQAFRRLPACIRFLVIVIAVNFLAFVSLRLVFWLVFRPVLADAPAVELLGAAYLGAKFDLRLALLAGAPLFVLACIPLFNPARHRLARGLWIGYFVVLQAAILLMYFVDFGHFDYVRVRLNASLLDHLQPIAIAAQMAWESYPVMLGFIMLAALTGGYIFVLRHTAVRELAADHRPLRGWAKGAAVALFAVLYLFGIYGKWSWYPLRWSDAYSTTHETVAAFALNPVLYFFDTYENRTVTYDLQKLRENYELVATQLELPAQDRENLSFARYVVPPARPARRPNLIVIHLESFAAFKIGVFGNPLNATPNFDAIARAGILFTNFFVPAHPTARSVFTMITGIPDFNVGRSASRNPLVVNQHTLLNALDGYSRHYFLGGSATWGNIRGVLAHNIEGLRVHEEGDYEAERGDVWGVSDLALFEKAHKALAAEDKPFFAFIQTAGNHRPYTIPEDRRGFEVVPVDDKTLTRNGFNTLAAYNGLRFMDHTINHFFRIARDAPYFDNTIFVLYGDHGVNATHGIAFEQLVLTQHHVPLVIYAPGLIRQARRIDTVASLVDLLPTSLGLMGIPYLNTTLGRDLLVPRPPERRFALIYNSILSDDYMLRVDPRGESHLYRYRTETATEDVSDRLPEKTAELRRLRDVMYEAVQYLLYHNPPRRHAPEAAVMRRAQR